MADFQLGDDLALVQHDDEDYLIEVCCFVYLSLYVLDSSFPDLSLASCWPKRIGVKGGAWTQGTTSPLCLPYFSALMHLA